MIIYVYTPSKYICELLGPLSSFQSFDYAVDNGNTNNTCLMIYFLISQSPNIKQTKDFTHVHLVRTYLQINYKKKTAVYYWEDSKLHKLRLRKSVQNSSAQMCLIQQVQLAVSMWMLALSWKCSEAADRREWLSYKTWSSVEETKVFL